MPNLVKQVFSQGREIRYVFPKKPIPGFPPLLFVHGAFAGAWMWDGVLPALAAAGYRAAALSLRGHGDSEGSDRLDWLSIDDYVDDLEVAVAWLNAEPVLLGHSMGGFVCQKYLGRHTARGLALLCSVPPEGLLPSQFYLLVRHPGVFVQMNLILSGHIPDHQAVRDTLFAGEVSDAVVAEFLSHVQRESSRALWDMSLFSFGPKMRERPPVLVIGAQADTLIPPFLVEATARTFKVPAHIYPGMGHAITHEKAWPEVQERLIEWLGTLSY